jgi:transposase
MDEHRVGLKPILRRVWARRGEPVVAPVDPGYEWLYVAGFVHPQSGRSSFWLLSGVDGGVFALLLRAFAQEQGVGRRKRILLVLDQAGWHGSQEIPVIPGLSLVPLPAYSPELQPVERVWPLMDEPLANRAFATIAEVEQVLESRCVTLNRRPKQIRAHTLFHWWPRSS